MHNSACSLRDLGRFDEALTLMRQVFDQAVTRRWPYATAVVGEDCGAVLVRLQRFEDGARLIGAAEALRHRIRMPRDTVQTRELAPVLDVARAAVGDERWEELIEAGSDVSVEDAMSMALEHEGTGPSSGTRVRT